MKNIDFSSVFASVFALPLCLLLACGEADESSKVASPSQECKGGQILRGDLCVCPEGSSADAEGICVLDDEETPIECPAHAFLNGDGLCECEPGYVVSNDGQRCVEDVEVGCPENSHYEVVDGQEGCYCDNGYLYLPSAGACVDMDEICPANSHLELNGDVYSCLCDDGFIANAAGNACVPSAASCPEGRPSYTLNGELILCCPDDAVAVQISNGNATCLCATSFNYDPITNTCIAASDDTRCPEEPIVSDANGNIYNTISLNGQCWMAEDLRVGQESSWSGCTSDSSCGAGACLHPDSTGMGRCLGPFDGVSIDTVIDSTNDCNFYLWEDAMQGGFLGNRGICPAGWHIPSSTEWMSLRAAYLPNALALMRFYGTSGFDARACGRVDLNFSGYGDYGAYWTSTEDAADGQAKAFVLDVDANTSYLASRWKNFGYSVRCIRD